MMDVEVREGQRELAAADWKTEMDAALTAVRKEAKELEASKKAAQPTRGYWQTRRAQQRASRGRGGRGARGRGPRGRGSRGC